MNTERPAVHARLLHRGWLRRVLLLTGEVNARLEYNGRGLGFETVLVNGREVARGAGYGAVCCPHFAFSLCSVRGAVPAHLDVLVAPWTTIDALVLTIDGRIVYGEGDTARLHLSTLPLPAGPPLSPADLPLPSSDR